MSPKQPDIGPQILNPTNLPLSPEEENILRIMFASCQRVTIKKELIGGLSGGRVLVVRPIESEHRPELPAVVKIALTGLIRKEWKAYQEHVHLKLPGIAEITDEPVLPPASLWGGLRYTLMGEGGTFEVESLYSYYHHASIVDIRFALEERLFKVAGPNWWQFSETKADWPLRAIYDFLLPVNLLIEPATPSTDISLHSLKPNAFPDRPLLRGDYVRLEGFVITEVDAKDKAVTLNVPPRKDGTPTSYRLRLQPVKSIESYQVDDEITSIEGRVRETRYDQLRDIAQDALEHRFDLTSDTLTAPDGTLLPNPLTALAPLLGRTRDVRVSCIHGDLNMDNVMVEPPGRNVSLIDFATARRDHALHDLLRLETEVITKLLPEALNGVKLLVKTIDTFFKRLHKVSFDPRQPVSTKPHKADLEKPFEMLVAIRKMARQCLFDPNDWEEYYEGLTLYLLGALKFKNLDRPAKEVAFWTAAMAYNFIEPVSLMGVPTSEDWSRLQKYLPTTMYQEKDEEACLAHLNALLRAVLTYLPRHVALDLLQKPVVAQNKGQFLKGTLLFADISGFTAMSEKLREKGEQEGAEEIARVINEYLDVMLAILFKYNGRLVKFGGDAMLCLFTGVDQGALNAVWAAWEMEQAMAKRFAKVELLQEIYPLEMKVGGNSGLLFAANVGTAEHMEYVLTGSAVERAAHAESIADKGDILISSETYDLVKDDLEAEVLTEKLDFYRVIGICSEPIPEAEDPWSEIAEYLSIIENDLWEVVDRLDALSPYLPAGVLPQLAYDPQEGQIAGQHRQVTVLFANFMGMSELIHARGIKDEAGIATDLSEYFVAMQEEVQYYGGAVNKVDLYDQGDKLMVLFGAPVAHELDVRRAALTALAMREAMSRLSSPAAFEFLSQRIGIHTGFVFAGNVGASEHNRREYTVMGDTVNLAARLMSAAEPGEIRISQRFWDQIRGDFETAALPPFKVKGVSGLVKAYQLQAVRSIQSRTRPRVLDSEIVGRENDLEGLEACLNDLSAGGWKQIVAIIGEAGVGKSRLVEEWRKRSEGATVTWLNGHGHSYGQKTNGVFIEVLEELLAFAEDDSQEARWRKLSARVRETFTGAEPAWLDEFSNKLAYLAKFLDLDLSRRQGLTERVEGLEAETLQLQTRLAICDLLTHAAGEGPLVLVLENLHWADEASLDMLRFVVDRVSDDVPLLFCLIFRPRKELPIWSTWQAIERSCPDCHPIALQELEPANGRRLLSNLLETKQLPEDFKKLVLDRANGNPLYIEEILHALIEKGVIVQSEEGWQITRSVKQVRVPDTLHQIIQSRIDELDFGSPGARRVLWMASVIGEEFAQDLLQDLFINTGRQKEEFWRHLRELRKANMIQRIRIKQDAAPSSRSLQRRYRFRHGLVQQVAYENMLVAKRREYHCKVGRWLEEKHGEDLPRHYNALAHHYDQGREWARAFHFHGLAGEKDARAYANQSAASHLQRALEIADYEAQDVQALGQVHFELGKVLVLMGEFDDALEYLAKAWDLFGSTSEQPAVLLRARMGYEIGRTYVRKGTGKDLKTASKWQDKGLELLPETPTAEAALLHLLCAAVGVRLADFDRVDRECEQALGLAQATGAKPELGLAHRLLGISARAQGRPDLALAHCQSSIEIYQELSDEIELAKGYANQGVYALGMGDWQLAETAYFRALTIQKRNGDTFQAAITRSNSGDLYCHRGDLEKGLTHAQHGLKIFTDLEAPGGMVFAHTVLATLLLRKGDLERARTQLLEARKLIEAYKIPEFKVTVGRWLARVFLTEENVSRAEEEIQALLSLTPKELGVEAEPIQCLWGQILAVQEKQTEAVQVLEASLQRLEQKTMHYQTGCALLALAGVLAQMKGRAGEARAHAERACAMFTKMGAKLDTKEVERLITGPSAATQGQLNETVQVLKASLERLEREQMHFQITYDYQIAYTLLALARVLAQIEGKAKEAKAHAERARAILAALDAKLVSQGEGELITGREE